MIQRAQRGFSCSPNFSSLAVVKKSRFRFPQSLPFFTFSCKILFAQTPPLFWSNFSVIFYSSSQLSLLIFARIRFVYSSSSHIVSWWILHFRVCVSRCKLLFSSSLVCFVVVHIKTTILFYLSQCLIYKNGSVKLFSFFYFCHLRLFSFRCFFWDEWVRESWVKANVYMRAPKAKMYVRR